MSSIMCMCKDWILEFFYLILIWGMGSIQIPIEVLIPAVIVVIVMLVKGGVYGMLLMILSIYK